MVKEEGLWRGADANPTGYIREARGKQIINEDEAELVKKIFKEYLLLRSITKIQKKFKEEEIPVWKFNRYDRILKNRLYIGEVSFAEEWLPGAHDPIVSREDFDKAQGIMALHRGKNYGKIKHMVFNDSKQIP